MGPSSVWCPCCDCGRVGEGTRGEEIGEEKRKREGGKMEVWEEYMQMITHYLMCWFPDLRFIC